MTTDSSTQSPHGYAAYVPEFRYDGNQDIDLEALVVDLDDEPAGTSSPSNRTH